jgi:hypothetical protein
MNRHPFRWEPLMYGLFFLAVVGTWAVWRAGALDGDQLAYVPAAILIVLGAVGIVGTLAAPRKAPPAPSTTNRSEEVSDDAAEADTQS